MAGGNYSKIYTDLFSFGMGLKSAEVVVECF